MPPATAMTTRSCSRDHVFEAEPLMPAEGGGARDLEQQRHARAVGLLDHAVELGEGTAERGREQRAERRLAGAAQADKRDAARAVRLFGEMLLQRGRDRGQLLRRASGRAGHGCARARDCAPRPAGGR